MTAGPGAPRLRIGVLGAAGIAPRALLSPARRRDDVEVAAVASRHDASEFASRHGIPTAYGRYDDLLADETIDLVYVALPPSEHARWTIAALEAGRDVLCEKPMTMDASEAREVLAAAERTGRRAFEAFHDHYHPLQAWVREFVRSGALGSPVSATATFNGANPFDPRSIRHAPQLGGGALMDLGCYPVHWLRDLFGEPEVVAARATLNPLGADLTIDASLSFADGVSGRVLASMYPHVALESSLELRGTDGRLRVDNLVFPVQGHTIAVERDGVTRLSTVAGLDTYDHQLAAVVEALRTGERLPTEGADYVGNMAVIDAVYAAAGVR
ncbi:Gfo/Idh/MocA family protein [Leifsonia sp. NPDC056824]|uniref:Gfo/Idh/MocA family protein n=1 Tax=Leifsonia sp. NPDC056824 TaxID=3345953 RepID=UPI0036A4C69D